MSMYLTDEMLAQAAKNVGETMLASLPDPEEYYHEFLPDFEQRMERLIRRTEKKRHIHQCLLRVAAAVLALVVGLSAWMAVDTKARAAVVAVSYTHLAGSRRITVCDDPPWPY